MSLKEIFAINKPHVVYESIDDEIIIIHLETGIYYSLARVGAGIWNLIEEKIEMSEIVDRLVRRYQGNREEIERAVFQFMSELQREALIVPDGFRTIEASNPSDHQNGDQRHLQKLPFEIPVFEKYSDMQEFLLVDPIHEVDERGWPYRKGESVSEDS